jgi:serine/threonine-protein kinase HipA
MKIGGDYRVYPSHNAWTAAAQDLGVDPAAALDCILALAKRAPQAFADAAAAPDVAALDRPLPTRLTDLVAERAARCEAILLEPPATPIRAVSAC